MVGIEELQKPWESFLHQELSPQHEDEDNGMKEKELCEWEPQKTEKDMHLNHLLKVGAYESTPGNIQMMKVHGGKRSKLSGKQGTVLMSAR